MKLRPDEIASILKTQIEGFEATADVQEVGTVIQVGDGIARVYGLDNCVSLEMLEFPHGVTGLALNLEEDNVGDGALRRMRRSRRATRSSGPAGHVGARRRRPHRPRRQSARPADRRQGPRSRRPRAAPLEFKAPGVVDRQPREGAAADRPEGARRDDPDRPRPARADHRRPPDRQDGRRDRRDHQPDAAATSSASTSRSARRARRSRRSSSGSGTQGAMEYTIVVVASASEPAPLKYIAPYAGCAMAEYFLVPAASTRSSSTTTCRSRRTRTGRCRSCSAARPGREALPRRRLLPPLAPARARRQALRRARRRFPDRAADHRDAGRRRLGVHPDQRDLDHRRPDLPRVQTCSTRASGRPSTSACRSPASAGNAQIEGDEVRRRDG